jgi:chromosome segregation ATPase
MRVNHAILDDFLRRGEVRNLFQVWIIHTRTQQQNRALKAKLRSLREDVGGIAESMGPIESTGPAVADEVDGLATDLAALAPSMEQATDLAPAAAPAPEVAATGGLAARRRGMESLTVDVEEAQRTAEAQQLADAQSEIKQLREQEAECGRVVDGALAHCKRMGKELQDRNREVAELRRRLAAAESTAMSQAA